MSELLLNGFVTLFVIIDPLGLVPLFLALTPDATPTERRVIALQATLIASAILLLFALAGLVILDALGISLGAFRVAGGLFLFTIAFELVFDRRQQRKERSAQSAAGEHEPAEHHDAVNVAAFPMAIPLMAGPGAIAAVILLSGSLPGVVGQGALVGVLAAVMAVTFAFLLAADRLDRLMGATGRAVVTRLLGVVLAALAVQFVADGVAELVASASA